jgi:GNAT superfamily N-acetyltransferase
MMIRAAKESDIQSVSHLVKGLSHYYLQGPASEIPDWLNATLTEAAFLERFCNKDYVNYVTEYDNTIVGYIAIKPGFHLYHLFVSEPYHGKGIGKALWHHCIEELCIQSCTVRSSLFAVAIYEQLGFTASGDIVYKDGIGFLPMVYSQPDG